MTALDPLAARAVHVASVRLPEGIQAEAVWNPLEAAVGLQVPTQRWLLRWRCTRNPLLSTPPEIPGPVASIGLNPSGAGVARGDMTLNTEFGLYRRWGVREFVKLNLFPVIATYPVDLFFGTGDPSYADYVIAQAVAIHRAGGIVIATWGGPYGSPIRGTVADRARAIERGLLAAGVPLHVLGLTRGGEPRHIRGIGRDARPVLWRSP